METRLSGRVKMLKKAVILLLFLVAAVSAVDLAFAATPEEIPLPAPPRVMGGGQTGG
jgi:hypothetical protein